MAGEIAAALVALTTLLSAPESVGRIDACAVDRLAYAASEEIRRLPDARKGEHFSLIYLADDGRLERSPVRRGYRDRITLKQIEDGLAAAGIGPERMIAFVHNHPSARYASTAPDRKLNRYPSGDPATSGDWRFARWLADHGAGGPKASSLFLYVMDVGHKLRRFPFAERDTFQALTEFDRLDGQDLPPVLTEKGLAACGQQPGAGPALLTAR